MKFILDILLNAAIIVVVAQYYDQIKISNYKKALLAAFIIAIINATLGYFLGVVLNFLTLGILSFVVQIAVTTLVIKIADALMDSFTINSWTTALVLATIISVVFSLFNFFYY